jgi:hypothetical protein
MVQMHEMHLMSWFSVNWNRVGKAEGNTVRLHAAAVTAIGTPPRAVAAAAPGLVNLLSWMPLRTITPNPVGRAVFGGL